MKENINNNAGLVAGNEMNHQPYDIIGDIHGYADVLEALLRKLGYKKPDGVWRHPEGRKVLFLGDFIDRGPSIPRTLKIVRDMVEQDEAKAIMGNHEYNALLYHTPARNGGWLRPRLPKNVNQHAATLAQFWGLQDEWEGYLAWFATLSLWLDLGGLRAVHATWDHRVVAANPAWRHLDRDFLHRSAVKKSEEFEHCEIPLKGIEIELPDGRVFRDHAGNEHGKIRVQWWTDPKGLTYHDLCFPEAKSIPHEPVPESAWAGCPGYPDDAPPVFFGHYWVPSDDGPKLMAPNVACLDFGVANNGPLTAYRWDGEQKLDAAKFVQVRAEEVAK